MTGAVYGGYSTHGPASNNTVTIEGNPTLSNAVIFGAYAGGTASGNTININAGVTVRGIIGGGSTTSSNNTLNLGATGISVGSEGINYTQTIKIGYTGQSVSFGSGTVLSSTDSIIGVGTLDISGMTIGSSTYGTMTLLSGGSGTNFGSLKVQYTGGSKTFDNSNTSYDIAGTSVDNDTANNVTFHYKTNVDTIALNSAKTAVTYTRVAKTPVSEVTIGSGMTWGTGRTSITSGCTFNSSTAINASNLTFTSGSKVTSKNASMTLLSGATNITGGSITQPVNGKGTVAAEFTENNIAYTGTATGTVSVSTGANAGKVFNTINSGTLSGINLGGWTGSTSTIPTGWTGTGVAVNTGNFSATPTSNIDIFSTSTANFFGSVTGDKNIILRPLPPV